MSFGCVPFVTNVGGMPEVVGENGRIVDRNSKKGIAGLIQNSIDETHIKGIKNLFLLETRKKLLLKSIR